jgi:7-keto-8-aminopelargonate synthetase-like enzyme
MDKAMGGTGGYLCGSKNLISFLRIAASASVLSSALTCGMAGAMIAAIDLVEQGQHVREDLQRKARYLKEGLRRAGLTVLGTNDIPSVPLLIGDEAQGMAFTHLLRQRGIFCPLMRWPAVPMGKSRLRLSLMARHERHHLDRLIEACAGVGTELGLVIGSSESVGSENVDERMEAHL